MYNYSWRLHQGLRWRTSRFPLKAMVKPILVIALLAWSALSLWLIVQYETALTETQSHMEDLRNEAVKAEKALIRCLNGHAAFPLDGEFKAVWCDKRATVETL